MPSFPIFLPKKLYDKVHADAKERGISISRYIGDIVEEYYARQRDKPGVITYRGHKRG